MSEPETIEERLDSVEQSIAALQKITLEMSDMIGMLAERNKYAGEWANHTDANMKKMREVFDILHERLQACEMTLNMKAADVIGRH